LTASWTTTGRVTWRDHLFGAVLCAGYLALLLSTASEIGMSRDESFYATAAESYARWFETLGRDRRLAFDQNYINSIWQYNHEHPALIKSLFALSLLAHQHWGFLPTPSLAIRFPGMVCGALLLWLLYIFGSRAYGRAAGAFAALAFALLPRPFYHAHLAAFDIPIVLMITLVVYAYWRSLNRFGWALITGLFFGLAMATKHNSWLVPGIFAIHFLWLAAGAFWSRKATGIKRVSLVPWWLFFMALFGPLLFVGTWPWLWSDTWVRTKWYVAFHTGHEYYNMAYFGVNYFWPPFPKSYPWVMTLFTVPITTLLLSCTGIGIKVRQLITSMVSAFRAAPPEANVSVSESASNGRDPRQTTVLFVGCILAPLAVYLLPTTPIFGGTKHWFPAYPFLALFAGVGFSRVLQECCPRLPSKAQLAAPGMCAALLLAPAALETAHSHPFGLSHYGVAAGGVPGAADYGMNRQFWGFTTGSLVEFFNRQMPNGGTVWICDTTYKAWQMLIEDGWLNSRIVPVSDIASADYAIVHHELHFAEVDNQIWSLYGGVQPVHVLLYDGVPIITVYRNPK
jgi:4-amino-4-deoxy-L-arabinose transferase-like glycosyltransferase